jgi:hypothetical protein
MIRIKSKLIFDLAKNTYRKKNENNMNREKIAKRAHK